MTMIEMLLAEVEREAERSKRALEQVPDGKYDWKPHERSMIFGYVALMVAQIPSWVGMIVTQDELDLAPKDGPKHKPEQLRTSAELLKALDVAVTQAREALKGTSEAHLMTPWRLQVGGKTVLEISRHVMIRETLSHLAHHRGQMTVYLRLMGAKVPALYGPSADDSRYD
jgi:uncharacterized damage-inducible protein DinB